MSSRSLTLSGVANTGDLLIKPADIFVALDGVYGNAIYLGETTEEIVISLPREYAKWMQNNALSYQVQVMQELKMAFSIGELGDIDKMALALGISSIDTTTPGVEKLFIDSNNTTIPDYLWIARTEFTSGKQIEFVMWKGQVLNPEDLNFGQATGSTEFATYGLGVEALVDNTKTDNNMGYFEFQN